MYSIDPVQPFTADQLWCWYGARRAIADSLEALGDAGAQLLPLVDDTDWQAKGVRALHETIADFSARCQAATSALHTTLWEIEAAG